MAGMDARCRRLRGQPGASSSENNTGKYREHSPRVSEEETDRLRARYPPKRAAMRTMLKVTVLEPQKYPRRPPGPDDDVGGLG